MIFHKNINFKFMETELKTETFKDSLNNSKMSKNNNIKSKEEEIKNNSIREEINSNTQIQKDEKQFDSKDKNELNDKEEKFKKINKEDKDKKINNKRVNNLLKDIYGSLSNINEVNNKVKSILLKRKKMNSVNSFRNSTKDQKSNNDNIKNKRKSITTNKNKATYSIKEKSEHVGYSINKNNYIYNRNNPNNENETTKNETGSVNMKSKSSNNFFLSRLDNDSTQNKASKNNNSAFYYKINSPVKVNLLEKEFNNDINIKFLKYDDLMNFENSPLTNEKYIEISHINNNTGMYDEEYENEKIIRYMKIKLKDEEKKLRVLEEQKNKLLNEEKLRRKVLMEKIKNKNRIKKQSLIKEYKKKINMIQQLQANNINEIRKLEIKKKIDEENIIKIDKICENININESLLTKSKTDKSQLRNSLTRSRLDNSIEGCNYLLSDNDTQQKCIKQNYSSNYFIYSKNNLKRNNEKKNKNKYNNESEEALTEEYKFNNSINELSSTCDNFEAEEKESFSNSQDIRKSSYKRKLNFDDISKSSKTKKDNINPFNYLFNYYQKVNKINNRKNFKDENMNVDNYLNQNTKKKKYHSENRKYNKNTNNTNINTKKKSKGSFTPNQDVISFIQTRVNKYNHSSNREPKLSKRLSQMTPYPSYLKYDINCKYNYKYSPSSVSNTNVFNNNSRRNSQRNEKTKSKNVKELNFKYIFLNHK